MNTWYLQILRLWTKFTNVLVFRKGGAEKVPFNRRVREVDAKPARLNVVRAGTQS